MTKNPILRVFFYSDVTPMERAVFEPLVQAIGKTAEVQTVDVNDQHQGMAGNQNEKNIWIIARHWRKALDFLGAKRCRKTNVFISVLNLDSPREAIHRVLAKKLVGPLPKNCTLLVHSPINFRFFGEMEKLNSEQLRYLPLPLPQIKKTLRMASEPFTVGSYTSFNSEGQLGFLASVAHYVLNLNPSMQFRLLGSGPLHAHAIRLGEELGLEKRFIVSECLSGETIADLDAFLYCPLRNDHFIPLLISSQYELATLVTEMSGIDEFVQDGKTGFVVPVNETKTMGELILRLSTHSTLREQLGIKFRESVEERYSLNAVLSTFFETLTGQPLLKGPMERAA